MSKKLVCSDGNEYSSILEFSNHYGFAKSTVWENINKKGFFERLGVKLSLGEVEEPQKIDSFESSISEDEKAIILDVAKNKGNIKIYNIVHTKKVDGHSTNVGVALLSDIHIGEVVNKASVLGKNEYNPTVAKERIEKYFIKLNEIIQRNPIDSLIIGILGDVIGGYIHPELEQTNSMSPMQESQFAQEIMLSGIKYLYDNTNIDIQIVCVIGNHGRTTRRKQFSNGWQMNYEYFMYKNMEQFCRLNGMGDRITFIIPESEMAVVDVMGKRLLFHHGDGFKSMGAMGGIYPQLFRWWHRISNTLKVDKAFIGHWHNQSFLRDVIVNGSVKGWDSFALALGMPYEEPMQSFCILNEKKGFKIYIPIFLGV